MFECITNNFKKKTIFIENCLRQNNFVKTQEPSKLNFFKINYEKKNFIKRNFLNYFLA